MKSLGGRFTLLREIGSGGMSRVFLGRDEILGRPIAVKILKRDHAGTDIGARFRREGRTSAKLSHPNIVQVYDAGEDEFEGEEASYIVMEYVPGGDLKALLDERGTISANRLSAIGADVAAGLAHAHERGVVHRDVKPHNILLEDGGRARLTDFGIARALDMTQATLTGFYLGTALYSAPEQLKGEGVTPKSDVYSLGVTLYQATVGRPPFTGTPIEIASQHVSSEPVPPSGLNPEITGPMNTLILACMSKDPTNRPTANEARTALLEAGRKAESDQANVPVKEPPPRREPKREPRRTPPPDATSRGQAVGRRRRFRGVAAVLTLVAAVAVIAALAAYTLPGIREQAGGGGQANGGGGREAQAEDQSSSGTGGGQEDQSSPDQQSATQQASGGDPSESPSESSAEASAQSSSGSSAEPASGEQASGSGGADRPADPEQAAVQTVEDHYAVAAGDDYQDAWGFLSSRYQRQLGSRGQWTGQLQTLERVEYTRGPTAQVSGDTATVSFSTLAYHTNRVQEVNGAMAYLVREGGGWKIDRLEVPAG